MDSNSRDPADQRPKSDARLRRARAVLAIGAVSFVVGVVVLTMGLRGLLGGDDHGSSSSRRELGRSYVIEAPTIDSFLRSTDGTRLADAIVYNNMPPIYEMTIEAIDVKAPVLKLYADSEGVPITPNSGDHVAWYDFSAKPGSGGNAVFAGHVTWAGDPAVFARLEDLEDGDTIHLKSKDRKEFVYEVFKNFKIDPKDPNALQVMAPTPTEIITLITCSGTWVSDPTLEPFEGDFTERIVVQARLVESAATVPRDISGE